MRIGINALSVTNRSGTGYYTQQLILALAELDRKNDYIFFLPEDCLLTAVQRQGREANEEARRFGRRLRPLLNRRSNIHPQMVSRRNRFGRVAWENYFLPREAKQLKLDLLHSPTGIAPIRLPCASVVTLHDLAFRRYPELFHWMHHAFLRFALPYGARHANAVITDSETIREEIIGDLKIDPEKIHAVPLGVDREFQPVEDQEYLEAIRQRYDLPQRFILALGTVEPRKNLLNLLDAFQQLASEEPDLDLVLVGRKGWKEEPVFERIESMGLSQRIHWLGFLPRENLPALYSLATACAYLSVYEGFGLPVLEAMACGTPVVASDIAVFREWAGKAFIPVDPTRPEAIKDALLSAVLNTDLRTKVCKEGLEKADQLSWEATAKATLSVYHEVLQLGSHSQDGIIRIS